MQEIEKLERWTRSGALWRVIHRTPDQVTIALVTCTGGEEAERFSSTDPDLLAWLGDRWSSETDDC